MRCLDMKIKTITYVMLRKTGAYENDRAEITIEVGPKDKLGDVVRAAKGICKAALKCDDGSSHVSFESIYACRETVGRG